MKTTSYNNKEKTQLDVLDKTKGEIDLILKEIELSNIHNEKNNKDIFEKLKKLRKELKELRKEFHNTENIKIKLRMENELDKILLKAGLKPKKWKNITIEEKRTRCHKCGMNGGFNYRNSRCETCIGTIMSLYKELRDLEKSYGVKYEWKETRYIEEIYSMEEPKIEDKELLRKESKLLNEIEVYENVLKTINVLKSNKTLELQIVNDKINKISCEIKLKKFKEKLERNKNEHKN